MYATVQSPDRDYIVRSRRGGRELLAGVYPESFRGTRRIKNCIRSLNSYLYTL